MDQPYYATVTCSTCGGVVSLVIFDFVIGKAYPLPCRCGEDGE
jgi:hypothetical protein